MKERTNLIDKKAFRFYTPKELHSHYNAFNKALADLMEKNSLINSLIQKHNIPFPVHYGFPIVHIVALNKEGRWHYFNIPIEKYKKKDGHRVIGADGNQNVPMFMPHLRLEVVTDEALTQSFDKKIVEKIQANGGKFPDPIEESLINQGFNQAQKPAVLFTAPMSMMLKKSAGRFLSQRFTLYQHIFGAGHEYPDDGLFYIGITARDWKKRWSEHRAAINRGSQLKFHKQFRHRAENNKLTYVHHKIMGVAPSLEIIQDLEEGFVEANWDDERVLNMIPGGKAGIKYLHKHKMLDQNVIPTPDTVERVLEDWLKQHPRKGLPAPWIAEAWKDDEFALNIICGPEGRLSIEQVLQIRYQASLGVKPDDIVQIVGAKNVTQVKRVIDGKTYGRVK